MKWTEMKMLSEMLWTFLMKESQLKRNNNVNYDVKLLEQRRFGQSYKQILNAKKTNTPKHNKQMKTSFFIYS